MLKPEAGIRMRTERNCAGSGIRSCRSHRAIHAQGVCDPELLGERSQRESVALRAHGGRILVPKLM